MKLLFTLIAIFLSLATLASGQSPAKRYLYMSTPDAAQKDYRSGQGILIFDIDQGHKFVRRIPAAGLAENGKPSNVKGIAASIPLQRVFITTLKKMMAIDLLTEKLLWEKHARRFQF